MRSEEMTQWLREATDLVEAPQSIPRPLLRQLTTTVTPALGDLSYQRAAALRCTCLHIDT